MNYFQAIDIIKGWLKNKEQVSNERILQLVNNDIELQQLIFSTLEKQKIIAYDGKTGIIWTGRDSSPEDVVFDVFISYTRKDNTEGRIDELLNEVGKRYLRHTGNTLNVFFDRSAIKPGEEWRESILHGVKQSKIFIAILSPHYLNSIECKKEWELFVQNQLNWQLHHLNAFTSTDSIIPPYIIKIPELTDIPEEQLEDWPRDIRKRNLLDLTDWYTEGKNAFENETIGYKFTEIEDRCYTILQDSERLKTTPNNIPAFFKEYISRVELVNEIKKKLNASDHSVIALWGLAGMGKSTLAFFYAKQYLLDYTGGCWYIPAQGMLDIKTKLIEFSLTQWKLQFTEEEKKDTNLAWLRVKQFLEEPYHNNHNYRRLLIFDNVDNAEKDFNDAMLDECALIGIHIIITCRQRALTESRVEWIQVDSLNDKEGMELLNRYKPINNTTDESNAKAIIKHTGNYPFALSIIGTQLQIANASYEDILTDLRNYNIEFLDAAGNEIKALPGNYPQKIISKLFEPLLGQLDEKEILALRYSILLPSDNIAIPWLGDLMKVDFPEFFQPTKFKSVLSNWQKLVRRLKSFSFWNNTAEQNIVRMHRLFQEIIKNKFPDDAGLRRKINKYVISRADFLSNNWHLKEMLWEIVPLRGLAEIFNPLDDEDSIFFRNVGIIEKGLGNYNQAKLWMQRAIDDYKRSTTLDHTFYSSAYSYMAMIEKDLGNYLVAKQQMSKSIDIIERNSNTATPDRGTSYSNMSVIEMHLDNYKLAKEWIQKAVDNDEQCFTPPHLHLGMRYSNMSMAEKELHNFPLAKHWMQKAIDNDEQCYTWPHPQLGTEYSNMSSIEMDLGDFPSAKEWISKAIDTQERCLNPPHPNLAITYLNMGAVEKDLNNYPASIEWTLKAIDNYEKCYSSAHQFLGICYHNLGITGLETGNYLQAKQWLNKAILNDEQCYLPSHPRLGNNYYYMGIAERYLENYLPAREWFQKAVINDEHYSTSPRPELGQRYFDLGMLEGELKNFEEAEHWMKKAVLNDEEYYKSPNLNLAVKYFNLSALIINDRENACNLCLKAYWMFHDIAGADDSSTQMIVDFLYKYCPQCFAEKQDP